VSRKTLAPFAWILLLAAALTLCGCARAMQTTAPQKRRFVLDAPRPAQRADQPTPADAPVLKVKRLGVSPSFAEQELMYRTGEKEYRPDHYNLFLAQPREMVTQAVGQWLDAGDLPVHVVGPESGLASDLVLEGHLAAIYADMRDPDGGEAVLALQFFLVRDTSFEYEVLFKRTYERRQPLAERSAQGAMEALNETLTGILTDLEGDVAAELE
jgi:ABC-type uncharacterized transport system auxiliary subunit